MNAVSHTGRRHPGRGSISWVWSKIARPRVLLAVKTSLAVGIAWFLAPHLPGVANDYPYYAPLGVLVSMYPTVVSSAKNGLQTLAGLAIGILLAAAVIILSEPNIVTISLVVCIGVLVAGSRWLGSGGEYAPIAALFVLIIGGQDADEYSIGYLVQMSFGVAVGLTVNLLIFPPLTFNDADKALTRLRAALGKHLADIGEALAESWPPEHEDWARQSQALATTAADVRAAVGDANESRKGNPRARLHRKNFSEAYEDLAALENVTFHVRDLSDVLAGAVWGTPAPAPLQPELRPPLRTAVQAITEVVNAWGSSDEEGDREREALDRADAALNALLAQLDEHRDSGAAELSPTAVIGMDLRRILAAIRVRVDAQPDASVASVASDPDT